MEDITSSIQRKGTKNYLPILVISIGAIITTSVALSLLHIMFVKYCKRRHERAQTLSIEPSTTIGLHTRLLTTIPILFYSSKTRDMYRINQGDQCVICLGLLTKGDLIRCLPNCGHVFHVPCIDHWFHAHVNCPICRCRVRAPPSDSSSPGPGGLGLPRTRSGSRLCHSTKLVLPIQGLGPRDLLEFGLRRSLSMDQSCVIIDTSSREQTCSSSSSSSSSIINNHNSCNPPLSKIEFLLSRLYQTQSNRRFNPIPMSSMGFRSLHGLRAGQGGTLRNNGILPY